MNKYLNKFFTAILFALFSLSNVYGLQAVQIISAFIVDQHSIKIELSRSISKDMISVKHEEIDINIINIEELEVGIYLIKTTNILDFRKRFLVKVSDQEIHARPHWKAIDELYTYEGDLGVSFKENQTKFKIWAPLASSVDLNLYKTGLDANPFRTIKLERGDKGVWSIENEDNLDGIFYTYSITNFGEKKEVLDPYAKSLGITTRDNFFATKGAIVNPASIGPRLDFANINGYNKREDAIIWEINIWDYTSDPDIQTEAPFGTFNAFSERIDYIKSLGITHVQLLPVLSYTYSDESKRNDREMEYKLGTNYNWGYGPDNYFSPEGMYSENPKDPALRIEELKTLVQNIHTQGIGVILDVVYNHTAKLSFLEDIVPGYYHFMDFKGNAKQSYGGGRPGTTHAMVRKLVVDSIIYWTREYKVDGFRYDLMGDLDAETIQIAFDKAQEINPNIIMVGECWDTYVGDDGEDKISADQRWMGQTNSVACFSDEMRNELKSGHGSEGERRFLTGGSRSIQTVFENITAKPNNMTEDDPGDVLQYIAAHDDLTLHDVIAQSIQKDPDTHEFEIQKRIRLGNTILLTSQGTAFIHAGQEYGRTKQWKSQTSPEREFVKVEGFKYPYFISNSYDASEAINIFDWDKVTDSGIHRKTMEYTRGLIALRKSTDAFRLGDEQLISENVSLVQSKDVNEEDLVIGYRTESTSGEVYFVFINADNKRRIIRLDVDLTESVVVVDSDEAGIIPVTKISGVVIEQDKILLDSLTSVVLKLK